MWFLPSIADFFLPHDGIFLSCYTRQQSGVLSDPGNPRRGSSSSEVSLIGDASTRGHHRENSGGSSSHQSTVLPRRDSRNPLANHFELQRRPSFPAQALLNRSPSPEQHRRGGNRNSMNFAFTNPWDLRGTEHPSSPTRRHHGSGSTER